jgi:hypothetical protein
LAAEKIRPISRIQNYVVARYRDGRVAKGVTYDFGPQKRGFHVNSSGGEDAGKVSEVLLSELKAVFFVKSLEGKKSPSSFKELLEVRSDPTGPIKVKITFFDGETLVGTTHGYTAEREGFFIVPLEKDTNNLRIFVISSAVRDVETWK